MQRKTPNQRPNQQEFQPLPGVKPAGSAHVWQQLGLGVLCVLFGLGFIFRVYIKSFLWLPVNMHSELKADYGVDELKPRLNNVQLELIRDAIQDQSPPIETEEVEQTDRYATLVSELQTPVATVTPKYTLTHEPAHSPTVTMTPIISTATATPTATSTANASATATRTELPSTQIISTDLPNPTNTRSPVATSTKKPPTQIPPTQPPTQPPPTATKPPTPTRVPPTAPPPTQPPYPKPTDNPYP